MQTKSKRERDQDLDKALKESFPASDALSTNEPDDPPIRPIGRKPPRFDFDRSLPKPASRWHNW